MRTASRVNPENKNKAGVPKKPRFYVHLRSSNSCDHAGVKMFPLDSGRDRGDGLHEQPPITHLTQACVLEETFQGPLTAKAKHREQQEGDEHGHRKVGRYH